MPTTPVKPVPTKRACWSPRTAKCWRSSRPWTRPPRILGVHLLFEDDSGTEWEFAFIHYNNRFFGGTRNEYRLTRMTHYMRAAGLVEGDTVVFWRAVDGSYSISHRRRQVVAEKRDDTGRTILQLDGRWAIIDL